MTNIRLATTQWSALIRIGAVTLSAKTSIIKSLRSHSESCGLQVLDASNGADTLVLSVLLLQEHHIDILVTDVVMKNMDGFYSGACAGGAASRSSGSVPFRLACHFRSATPRLSSPARDLQAQRPLNKFAHPAASLSARSQDSDQ